MAIELARVIHDNGGIILINAPVAEIMMSKGKDAHDQTYHVNGVKMADAEGTFIAAKQVVSGAGYARTFQSLVSPAVCSDLGIPPQLKVQQSAGFVMINIG